MCWSATADLVAGTAVAGVGAVCVAGARRVGDLPMAAVPLLLGAHQLVEARVWQLGGGTGPATLAWAVIAVPLLALWTPCAVLGAAPPSARARLLVPLLCGAATAAYSSYVFAGAPVRAEIRGHTMGYVLGLAHVPLVVTAYLVATVGALLLSGDRVLRAFGVLAGAGAAVCWALWRLEFVSTWCALAAVCSVVVLGWVRRRPRPVREPAAAAGR